MQFNSGCSCIELEDGKEVFRMCGIAGAVGTEPRPEIMKRMLETMSRRGPDEKGSYCRDDCFLIHRRLTIIDPEGGHQPMKLYRNGEHYILVYNGELYNTDEIRADLIRAGHGFLGHSDTEVVLHAYAQWGEACLDRINGIFAFAVWEERSRKLFLARDRIGVKPLFYTLRGGVMIFSSEIKTILAHPYAASVLDEQGAAEILMLGPGRTPGCGVFKGISELEPGCCGYYETGKFRWKRYWKLRDREHRENFAETAETVRVLVMDAIRRQTVSDFPVGTFLSGGLDSSLITAICAKDLRDRGERLQTFSVDYENNDQYFVPGKFQPNSDGHYIRLMQEHLDTEHHWSVLTPEDLISTLEDATIARDLPGMADVDFSLLAFCRQIRPYVKVALSGECADEIFGGYPWYRDPEVRAIDGFPWAQNTYHRKRLMSNLLRGRIDGEDYVRQRYQETCMESDIQPGIPEAEKRMKEMVNLNFRWFMQTLLDRKDRMSMYCGLEVRVPFCDYRIAEYLYGVPWEYKDHMGIEKGLLRTAMEGIVPEEILWRKKSPYPKTFDPRYGQLVSERLKEIISDGKRPIWHMVDRDAAKELLTAEHIWPWYGQLMKGPQTIAYLLQIDFWLSKYKIDFSF